MIDHYAWGHKSDWLLTLHAHDTDCGRRLIRHRAVIFKVSVSTSGIGCGRGCIPYYLLLEWIYGQVSTI
jgi:hypothetical protein